MQPMTMRERMLAVLCGEPMDRIPFVNYHWVAASDADVWAACGRDQVGILRWTMVHRCETPHCRFESTDFEQDGLKGVRTVLQIGRASCRERV